MAVRSFRDLVAWQRAIDLAEGIYLASHDWPSDERFGLTTQIRRAAVSVMANIGEGQGRTGSREFLHHLSIADGSLSEVEAHLLFAHRLHCIDEATLDRLLQHLEQTRSPLRGLIQRLRYLPTSDLRLPLADNRIVPYHARHERLYAPHHD